MISKLLNKIYPKYINWIEGDDNHHFGYINGILQYKIIPDFDRFLWGKIYKCVLVLDGKDVTIMFEWDLKTIKKCCEKHYIEEAKRQKRIDKIRKKRENEN